MIELDNKIIRLEVEKNDNKIDFNMKPDFMNATVSVLKNSAEKNILTSSHAILEIIKNGYDADATKVKIKFNQEKDHIIIEDDGEGFTSSGYEAFKLVGKTNKKQNQKTKKGRLITGMNGSGAYSTIKLGKRLEINSYNKENNYFLSKGINWRIIFDNPDAKLSEIPFYSISNERQEVSGTVFKIEELFATNIDWEKLKKELLYITINRDFKVQIFTGDEEFKNINLENRINELENYDFVKASIVFEYNKGIITGELKKGGEKYPIGPVNSKTSDFVGVISGKYLDIDKNGIKNSKNISSEEIFNDKIAMNLFYHNEMLILTSSNLGIDFSKFSSVEKGSYGFRNSFGYTAVRGTKFIFNESRTNISEDSDGQYKKYKEIIDEIYSIFLEKIKSTSIQDKSKKSGTPNGEEIKKVKNLPKLTVTTKEKEILADFDSLINQLNNDNRFYPQLCYCIVELKRVINMEKYTENWNISYHALVRVYCEILFIYKLHEFYSDQDNLSEKLSMFKDNKNPDDFSSIGSLLNTLNTKKLPEIEKLKKDFKEKTNQNELYDVQQLVKTINNHIHNPHKSLKISVSQDLITIFTKWV